MDKADKEKLLERMRNALQDGRVERLQDLRQMKETVEEEIIGCIISGERTNDTFDNAMHLASNRKMLHELGEKHGYANEPGVMGVKDREPHQKRPSVRALKKSRSRGNSPSI